MSTVTIRLALALSLGLALAGCQTTGPSSNGSVRVTHLQPTSGTPQTGIQWPNGTMPNDPLLDAPHRAEVTCTAMEPVTVLKRFREVSFACPDLGVSASYDELQDAGWRLMDLNIGDEVDADGHVGLPITLRLRKLF